MSRFSTVLVGLAAALAGVAPGNTGTSDPGAGDPLAPPFTGRYTCDGAGKYTGPGPRPFLAVYLPAAGLSLGTPVYCNGYDSTNDGPTVAAADGTTAKHLIIGNLVYTVGNMGLIRLRGGAYEMAATGLTAGAAYCKGTDGLLAKVGDSNYPTTTPLRVGVAIAPDTLLAMELPAAQGAPTPPGVYTGAGALLVQEPYSLITTAATYTLAAGVEPGQCKRITAADTSVVTGSFKKLGTNYGTATWTAAGGWIDVVWDGVKWQWTAGNAVTLS